MEHLWTQSGRYFGYRDGDSLFACGGAEAGRFYGDRIYGWDGRYLGELRNGRLITANMRPAVLKGIFGPRLRGAIGMRGNIGARGMIGGYSDFPSPDEF